MNEKLCLPQKKSKAVIIELYDWMEIMITVILFAILIFSMLIRVFSVGGESMIPTLQDGDKLIAIPFAGEIRTGDIVVFVPSDTRKRVLIKRVIAVGGQQVDIDAASGMVRVDGAVLEEGYIAEPMDSDMPVDLPMPAAVPAGCLFVMGDNRNHSYDSRAAGIGMIDERYVVGKIVYRIWPYRMLGPVTDTGNS